MSKLAKTMHEYNRNGFSKTAKAYQNALAVILEYVELHSGKKSDVSYLEKIFQDIMSEVKTSKSQLGGTSEVRHKEKVKNKHKNFKDLFSQRYSVREYDNSIVEIERVENSIELSMKAPSICNRQTSRVQIITDKTLIRQVLQIQAGMNGYDTPPMLLAVLTDTRHYVAIAERNQPYIDGGLFGMSLLLALEYEGLAACPLNAMFNRVQDKKMRALLSTKDYENYIMFISVGNFKDMVKVPRSFRYSGKEITQ